MNGHVFRNAREYGIARKWKAMQEKIAKDKAEALHNYSVARHCTNCKVRLNSYNKTKECSSCLRKRLNGL